MSAPGGVIHTDRLWFVSHHTGRYTDPGELIVKTRLLPRTAAIPRGHVISDLYRRARNLLRRVGLARNPSAAERAEVAARIRLQWGA